MPALGELGDKVDSVSGLVGNLPDAAKGPISTMAAEGMGKLQPVVDKVLALPGVGSIVSPVLEPMLEKLQEIGG